MNDSYYIGLDVHAKTVAIAWAGPDGSLEYHGTCVSSNRSVQSTLRKLAAKLGTGLADLKVCYEAGPTGFVLARHLIKLGLDVTIVAPSLIPQRAGERVKTGTCDALKLARLHRAGELKPIHIPDANDEAIRDVCRARTDASGDLRRAKQRPGAFLLRNGHTYTGKCKWTPGHFRHLRELALPCPVQKIVLEEYLQAVDAAEDRIAPLEKHMEEQLQTWQSRAEVAATMAMKGFKIVRWMLIESAKAYTKPSKAGLDLTKRQEGIPRAIKELSWRAQNRLGMKYPKLAARGVHENKAITAVARELCAFLWELHVKVLPANPITR